MSNLRKTTFAIIFLCFIGQLVKPDYFAGLPIDQKLIDQANKAMEHFKAKLQKKFYCEETKDEQFQEQKNNNSDTIAQNGSHEGDSREDGRWDWRDHKSENPSLITKSEQHSQKERSDSHWHFRRSKKIEDQVYHSSFKKNCDRREFIYFKPAEKGYKNQIIGYYERRELYNSARHVDKLLAEIKTYLVQYNNVIIGQNNSIAGNNNVVIGSRNSLAGSNYWVFDSDVSSNSTEDGVLIIQSYLIEMLDIPDILTQPREVIRCINQKQSDDRFHHWWAEAPPHLKMCL